MYSSSVLPVAIPGRADNCCGLLRSSYSSLLIDSHLTLDCILGADYKPLEFLSIERRLGVSAVLHFDIMCERYQQTF